MTRKAHKKGTAAAGAHLRKGRVYRKASHNVSIVVEYLSLSVAPAQPPVELRQRLLDTLRGGADASSAQGVARLQ